MNNFIILFPFDLIQNEKFGDRKPIVMIHRHRLVKLVRLSIMHNIIHQLDSTVMIKC